MSTYFFQLGNTPQLSILEIEALLKTKLEIVSDYLAALTTKKQLNLPQLQLQAGGLVKTYQYLAKLKHNSPSEIEQQIINHLISQTDKIVFSVTSLGKELPQVKLASIKKQLIKQGIKARYLESGGQGLTAAVLTHHQVHELVIIRYQQQLCLAKTVTIQDIDDWSKRDRAKPYADRKKGLLPLISRS